MERLLTVADLAMFPTDLPSGDVRYELDNGRLVVMPPPGFIHSRADIRLAKELLAQGEERGLGIACGQIGVILWRNPDRLVGPDASFIANASLPVRIAPEGYLETIPDLVVEVRSPNDSLPEVGRKVADYIRAGVKVILVPDPAAQTVTAHRNGQQPQVFTINDTLTIPDVIPGFQLPVIAVFA